MSSFRPFQRDGVRSSYERVTPNEQVGIGGSSDKRSKSHNATINVGPSLDTNSGSGSSSVGNKESIVRLFALARPERRLMMLSTITMALGTVVSLAVPKYSGKIIDLSIGATTSSTDMSATHNDTYGTYGTYDDMDVASDEETPLGLLMNLLLIMTLSGFLGYFRTVWQAKAGHYMVARMRRKLYAAILSQDASYFDTIHQGDLISRLSSDADLVQGAVTDQALALLRNFIVAFGAIALLFYTSVSLAAISVAILPPIAVCARFVGRRMKERQKRVRELHAEATSLAEQALTCIRTVQQFVMEDFESGQYNDAVNQAHLESIRNKQLRGLFGSVMGLLVNLALLCVLGYGGVLVSQGELSPGDLTGFVMYSVLMGTNISGASSQYIDLMKAVAAANRVFEILDREPAIPPPLITEKPEHELLQTPTNAAAPDGTANNNVPSSLELTELGNMTLPSGERVVTPLEVIPMSIDFQNVVFSYPTRPESSILNGLTLSITAGQVLALVGTSGAGKSTIASLLTRLYDVQSGDILLDGTSLQTFDPQHVRRTIGIVVQEPLLFPTSIAANIRYGTPDATSFQIQEAARLAHVLEFTDTFSDGLETLVGPRGTQLSGGQKQRVAVARCILKNPPVVIFDESTSALDAESEAKVQEAIDTACKGRTVIIIAHRLSTIRNADAIAVLKDGKVAEVGSFEELIRGEGRGENVGAFQQLMEKQLLKQ